MQMDSANLPSQGDLNSLYGAANPLSYMRGYQNQDLADQFRQQAFGANANTVQSGQLANQQAEQINPLLIASRQADTANTEANTANKQIANQSAGIDLGNKQSNEDAIRQQEQEKLLTQIGSEKYDQFSQRVLQDHIRNIQSGDPEAIQKTAGLIDLLGGSTASGIADRIQKRQVAELEAVSRGNIASGQQQTERDIEAQRSGTQLQVSQNAENARITAAQLNQKMGNALLQELAKPNPDMNRVNTLTRAMQTTTPGWSSGVDLGALQRGQLQGNVPASNTSGTTSSGAKYTIVPTQ